MFHIPLFAALILAFNRALFKFVSSDYHGTKWRTKHTLAQYNNVNTNTSTFQTSFYQSVHFLRYISRSLHKFKHNSPRLTPAAVISCLHHGRRFIPRVLPTTDDKSIKHTLTKTQLHLFSYASFKTPLIFNLGIRWRRVVNSMSGPFYPRKKYRYSLSMKMDWPQSQFGCFAVRIKLLSVTGLESRTAQAVA